MASKGLNKAAVIVSCQSWWSRHTNGHLYSAVRCACNRYRYCVPGSSFSVDIGSGLELAVLGWVQCLYVTQYVHWRTAEITTNTLPRLELTWECAAWHLSPGRQGHVQAVHLQWCSYKYIHRYSNYVQELCKQTHDYVKIRTHQQLSSV